MKRIIRLCLLFMVSNNENIRELITTNTIHNVKLLENRAVRNYNGASIRVWKGMRISKGQSESHQVMRHIATGDLVLTGSKVFFDGDGQSRTIDLKKINRVIYFSNVSGIQVSVSNRQKSMEFRFSGHTIDDGRLIADAIVQGRSQVQISKPKLVYKKGGCYVATCVYGSYEHDKVKILRNYRDTKLEKSFLGRLFIKTYYAVSPSIVKYFGDIKVFKKVNRKILDKIISKIM